MTPSPIVLFVYNRLSHTMRTVEALQKNHGSDKSTLYIFSDGPKDETDSQQVEQVRNYLKSINGFDTVIVAERQQNLGLAQSIISGVSEVIEKHGRVIVLEDDLVTSPFFLKFMNDALTCYEDEDRVAAIHGYTFPLKISLPETFFLRNTGCWGWGTWLKSWVLFEADGQKLLSHLKNLRLTQNFDMNGAYPYTRMLELQVAGAVDSWAVRWHASTFLKKKLTLYPGVSLVKNIGHDGSGIHCGKSKFYDVGLADSAVKVYPISICENVQVLDRFEAYNRRGHSGIIRYCLWKLFGKLVRVRGRNCN